MNHHVDRIFNEMIDDVRYIKIYSPFLINTKSINNIAKK